MVCMQKEIKNSFTLISLLKQSSINAVNDFLKRSGSGSQYTKKIVGKSIRVIRTRKRFGFFNKLMREKPGFNKQKEKV